MRLKAKPPFRRLRCPQAPVPSHGIEKEIAAFRVIVTISERHAAPLASYQNPRLPR